MERIIARVFGFVLIFWILSEISDGWDLLIRLLLALFFLVLAIFSTSWSYNLLRNNVIEASSHLTFMLVIFFPIYGLAFILQKMSYIIPLMIFMLVILMILVWILVSRCKFLLIKENKLILRGLFNTIYLSINQLHKIENRFSTWYFTIKIGHKLEQFIIIPSWYEELQRKIYGKSTSIDKMLEQFNKMKEK